VRRAADDPRSGKQRFPHTAPPAGAASIGRRARIALGDSVPRGGILAEGDGAINSPGDDAGGPRPARERNSMKRSLPLPRAALPGIIAVLAIAAIACGCASTNAPPPDESQLLAAGFKVVVAKTARQQQHLQTLPPGRLTEIQRNGIHYFVYPDVARNQIYVGTPKEYSAYLRVHPGSAPTPGQQHASDLASYNRQDSAMRSDDARDLADPYYFWDSFDNLGWN
jgi:hypothetical protein